MTIDRDLVEKITRQVLERMGGGATESCYAGLDTGRSAGGDLLVVVDGGTVGVEEAIEQIRGARRGFSGLTIFVTRCGENTGTANVFAARLGADRVLSVAKGSKPEEALARASAVVIPLCTLTNAAKISFLMADGNTSAIGVAALERRLPVVIATNSLMMKVEQTPTFRGIGEEHVARLRTLGIKVCDVREIGAALSGGRVSAPAPSYQPASSGGYSTGLSASVQCQPAVDDVKNFVLSALADDPSCQPCAHVVREAIDKCIAVGACRIGTIGSADPSSHTGGKVAGMIDHTLLKANATPAEVEKLCAEAREYVFKSVCINPQYVSMAKRLLQGSPVLVCTVVGFPLGATTAATKAAETRDAIADGADEIDMVINIGRLKAKDYDYVKHDIEGVVEAAKGRTTKVILETSLLNDEEKVAGCQLSVAAGAHFVKTSTGFSGGGATAEDIALMRKVVGPNIGVKASGGVRTKEDAEAMIKAGATRIGASASIEIATGKKSGEKKGY